MPCQATKNEEYKDPIKAVSFFLTENSLDTSTTRSTMAHRGQPDPRPESDSLNNAFDLVNLNQKSGKFIGILPPAHVEQPVFRETSKWTGDSVNPDLAFWRNVSSAFDACRQTVSTNLELSESEVGKEWVKIIQRRRLWIGEDDVRLKDRIDLNRKWGGKVHPEPLAFGFVRPADRTEQISSRM